MSSILESQYNEPTRPFSQKELKDKQDFLYKKLRIGTVMACHPKCKHFYLTRRNSRKEQDIQANLEDIGNCSVCWKINKTPYNQKHLAQDLVYHYDKEFSNKSDNITHYRQDLERVFYTWLYEDQNQQRPRRQRINNNDNNDNNDTEVMEAVSV